MKAPTFELKKNNALFAAVALLAMAALLQACSSAPEQSTKATSPPLAAQSATSNAPTATTPPTAAHDMTAATVANAPDGHAHGMAASPAGHVPHFASSAAEWKDLPPVLDAAQFTGKTRLAYEAVKEMPQTIAQMPCYCHCDEGFGHKSLQTCFATDHASHCAICVEEALLAHRLQKEEHLKPAQIRERIIAEFGQ